MISLDRIPVAMNQVPQSTLDDILQGMCNGLLLTQICEDNAMPLPSQVREYVVSNAEFGKRFNRAMEMQAHMLFEEAVITAQDTNAKSVNMDRFKVDTLLKAAGKILPKVYGDKADVSNVIPIQINMNLGSDDGGRLQRTFTIDTGEKE